MSFQTKTSSNARTRLISRSVAHNPYRQGLGYGYIFEFKAESLNALLGKKPSDKEDKKLALLAARNVHSTETEKKHVSPGGTGAARHHSTVSFATTADDLFFPKDQAFATCRDDGSTVNKTSASMNKERPSIPDDDEWAIVSADDNDDWTVISGVQ